ncbi:MAG: HD domain-containing protein [Prolixibacteraceae bacterium]
MENWVNISTDFFEKYIASFKGLSDDQQKNFKIKKAHSYRVAENARWLAVKLKQDAEGEKIAFLSGLFHDIGRFKQLVDYNTFHDQKSIDHADYAVDVLRKEGMLNFLDTDARELIFTAIFMHNKFDLSKKLTQRELLYARILRDADKLDILKVLTDYYSGRNQPVNHTLTWELPKGKAVSKTVAREVLAGKLVSKSEVKSEIDVKIMQLSWIYDLNFRPSVEYVLENRFLEKIYNTLSKTDTVIEIYRKVKVYAENKILV